MDSALDALLGSVGLSVGLGLVVCVIFIIAVIRRKSPKVKVPPRTVLLYQVGRGPWAPSMSPFPLKLETFLRMAKIPYMNDHSGQMSSKGKTPWIEYEGLPMADSQFCVEFLKKEFNFDPSNGLSIQERAVARAFRELVEENYYWTMCYEIFVSHPSCLDVLLANAMSWSKRLIFKLFVGRAVKRQLWGQGIGRHSDIEIWNIAESDLRALSDFLGSKPFMMGEEAGELDCAVFGMLAMAAWLMRGTRHEQLIHGELKNLLEYCERMRDEFWPDWNERCMGEHYVNDHHKLYTF